VVPDLDRRRVIEVLDGCQRRVIERWLMALPEPVRAGIEVVSIAPSEAYRQAISTALPQAQIVCDRFHLVRGANTPLDAVRRERQREAHARRPKGTRRSGQHVSWRPELYRARHRLLKARERLSSRERRRLTDLFAADPVIAEASRDEAYFAGARIDDDEMRDAAAEDEQRRAEARARHGEATRSNLGLGHDIRAGLIQPSDAQLSAVRDIICRLLVRHHGEVIAYGAGWSDPERQQPVGDTGRHEPRHIDAILAAELDRALADPDPLRGIAQLTTRWAAAFVLDPDGVTCTKALGTERMSRKLSDALPGGDSPLRTAVWEFLRPMLSPTLAAPNRDAFINDHGTETTVDLDKHRSASDLDELDLDEPHADQAA
jgi:hypothetical protein